VNDYNDERWIELKGGYRTRFDPRPALSQIRDGVRSDEAWTALWEDLHHQGVVGEASYAAVPSSLSSAARVASTAGTSSR
jgi:hypothetical protein